MQIPGILPQLRPEFLSQTALVGRKSLLRRRLGPLSTIRSGLLLHNAFRPLHRVVIRVTAFCHRTSEN